MPYAGAPQVNQEDEEPSQGNDSKGKQVEQPGERRKTQKIYDWVDQLLPVRRHEKPDGDNGKMASPQNPSGELATKEKGTDEV